MNTKLPMQLVAGDIIVLGDERLRVASSPKHAGHGRVEVVARSDQGACPMVTRKYMAGYVFLVEQQP